MKRYELEDDEAAARKLREFLCIDDQDQPDMMTVIVKLKHHGLIADYERVSDENMPDDEACWDAEKRLLRLRESVFCAANQISPSPRARWTIAHEIGHAVRGHQGVRHRNVSERSIE